MQELGSCGRGCSGCKTMFIESVRLGICPAKDRKWDLDAIDVNTRLQELRLLAGQMVKKTRIDRNVWFRILVTAYVDHAFVTEAFDELCWAVVAHAVKADESTYASVKDALGGDRKDATLRHLARVLGTEVDLEQMQRKLKYLFE